MREETIQKALQAATTPQLKAEITRRAEALRQELAELDGTFNPIRGNSHQLESARGRWLGWTGFLFENGGFEADTPALRKKFFTLSPADKQKYVESQTEREWQSFLAAPENHGAANAAVRRRFVALKQKEARLNAERNPEKKRRHA
jgi:hypothetical protein